MVYAAISTYGVAQDNIMVSSYRLEYIQSVAKAIYHIDASSLYDVASKNSQEIYFNDSDYCLEHSDCSSITGVGEPYFDLGNSPQLSCSILSNYPSVSVAELLKRDLEDVSGSAANNPNSENSLCLDNQMGIDPNCPGNSVPSSNSTPNLPLVPGKLALRCALFELMKPIHSQGVRYFADIVKENNPSQTVSQPTALSFGWQRVTDSYIADIGTGTPSNPQPFSSCEDVQNNYNNVVFNFKNAPASIANSQVDLLTVAVPFRVPYSDQINNFYSETFRICIWNSQLGNN